MPTIFISTVRTLTDKAQPMFPGISGANVVELTLKARVNGFVILSNIDESDGFTVGADGSLDIITMNNYDDYNLNELYWKNSVPGTNCVVEVFGKRRV